MRRSYCRHGSRLGGILRWPRVCVSAGALAFISAGAAVLGGVFTAAPSAAVRSGAAPSAAVRSAAVRSGAVRSAAVRSAAVRSAAVRSAAVRSAAVRFAGPSPAVPSDEDPATVPSDEDPATVPSEAAPSAAAPPTAPSAAAPPTAPSGAAPPTAPSAAAPPAGSAPQSNPASKAMIRALSAGSPRQITPVAAGNKRVTKRAVAARVALKQLGRRGSRVLGTSLAYVGIPGHRRRALVWLVSVNPAGGLTSVSSASLRANFIVEMISARSHRWLMTSVGRSGQLPPLPNIPPR